MIADEKREVGDECCGLVDEFFSYRLNVCLEITGINSSIELLKMIDWVYEEFDGIDCVGSVFVWLPDWWSTKC